MRPELSLTRNAGVDVGKEESLFRASGSANLYKLLWESTWRFLEKLEIDLPQDPARSQLGTFPVASTTYYRHACSSMFIAVLVTMEISQQPFKTSVWKDDGTEPGCPLFLDF